MSIKKTSKREQILAAAKQLFLDQGFSDTSMDKIAEQAKVSKQTVYAHFGGKEELFSTAITSECQAHQLRYQDLDLEQPCQQTLQILAEHYLDLLLSDEAIRLHRTCISAAERHPEVCDLFYQAGPTSIKQLVADYMREQHKRGKLNLPDPYTAACQFLFMLKAEAHLKSCLNLPCQEELAQLPDYITSCVELFLRAYGPCQEAY